MIKRIRCLPKSNSINTICWAIKNIDGINADGAESVYFNNFRKKRKGMRLKVSQGSVTAL